MSRSDLANPHRLVTALGTEFKGEVVDPGHPDFGQARRVRRGDVDRRPALVVRPADVASVASAVRIAHDEALPLAIRGGGHRLGGTGTCDGGLVVDLSLMRDVRVDTKRGLLRAQGGVTWRELDHAAGVHQLATTGSVFSGVGVAGHTLAGGLGWLMRGNGLSCDNLRGVELVTAAGRVVSVDYYRHAELFWAVRGGGGNFGVVTELTFQPQEVHTVLAGFLLYRIENAAEVLRGYQEYCRTAPDAISTIATLVHAPVEDFVPEDLRGRPVLTIAVCVSGEPDEAERVIAPLRALHEPEADLISRMPYRRAQTLYESCGHESATGYSKSGFIGDLSTWLIDMLVRFAATELPPGSRLALMQMGGAVADIDPDATAFAHRGASHFLTVVASWRSPESKQRCVEMVRRLWSDIAPFTSGAYAGCIEQDDESRVRSAYSTSTWERLAEIKRAWDPDNLFRLNANVPPAADTDVDCGRSRKKYASRGSAEITPGV